MANKGCKFPPEILNTNEVMKFIASFPMTSTGKRNQALFTVYLRAALRCNEALALRPCDINWDDGAITVLQGKGGKRRIVGIDQGSLELLKPWKEARPFSQFFFCTHKGGRLHDSYVRRLVKRHGQLAGIEKRIHVHAMRHTSACQLADEGIDIRLIQRQLGHSSLAVTDRYLNHIHPSELIDAIKNRPAFAIS